VANPEFFMKTVPLLDDGDDVAMVLSPQCFYNTNADADIFNHSNIHFWECVTSADLAVFITSNSVLLDACCPSARLPYRRCVCAGTCRSAMMPSPSSPARVRHLHLAHSLRN
jgi:hypothetical protein